jgi:hypothetical protein
MPFELDSRACLSRTTPSTGQAITIERANLPFQAIYFVFSSPPALTRVPRAASLPSRLCRCPHLGLVSSPLPSRTIPPSLTMTSSGTCIPLHFAPCGSHAPPTKSSSPSPPASTALSRLQYCLNSTPPRTFTRSTSPIGRPLNTLLLLPGC